MATVASAASVSVCSELMLKPAVVREASSTVDETDSERNARTNHRHNRGFSSSDGPPELSP